MYFRAEKDKGNNLGILFWKPDGNGYTEDIHRAGQYKERHSSEEVINIPVELISYNHCMTIVPFHRLHDYAETTQLLEWSEKALTRRKAKKKA